MSRTPDDDLPPQGYANYVLAVLLAAYILSFVDRNILALLVGPIRAEFDITDFQFSILHGWAFTLFYIVLGLPIGWLADRYSRKWIITAGVLAWSVMTCLCGFAKSFGSLFAARVGVGVGEATLSPAAYSLMGDYFSPERLRWATAVFTMGITLGSGGSYLIGGWLYDWFSAGRGMAGWAWLQGFSAWQLTFIAVGLPGLLVVALLLAVREPPRRRLLAADTGQAVPVAEWLAHLRGHWQAYTALMLGVSMMSIVGYGTLTWYPEFLFRTYGLSKSAGGAALGTMFIVAGTAGALGGAWFASLLQRRGYRDANLRLVMLAALLLIAPATLAPLLPRADWAIWLSWPVIFVHYTHFGVAMAALQLITPNRLRAQTSALMLFMANLFGLALGGSVVAFFTDFVFGYDDALRYSLALCALLMYPAAAAIVGWGLRHYRAALM
ncbi:MAG TPA: MFS transporter [Spongiibacteraceae bacterium]|jgi:MFS family permease|nr:MFS transporter [Spongiibacteraceae bacterium]HUH36334.1 MFS transporter [Spongiibacteraceae bacterium]